MDQTNLTTFFTSRPQAYAWFLGAGASRMSGLPTATDIIWELKRRYYCREENQEITRQDMQNQPVQARIQSFMDSRGFPPLWADHEYTTYFEKIFGQDKGRQRAFLRDVLAEDRVTLTVGNRILGALLAAGLTRVAFTTNFDSVVERAFAEVSARSLAAYHLEGPIAAVQALNNEEFPLYCKLHGDFRYDSVKNLSDDLVHQDRQLALALQCAAARFGFIVAGYSGRDASVMALFHDALAQPNPFPSGLFWTTIKGAPVLRTVTELITAARAHRVNAHIVEIETFDAFLLRLWRNIPNKPTELDTKVRRTLPATVNIPIPAAGTVKPLMRLNALPIRSLPKKCLVVRVRQPLDWTALRALQRNADSRLIFTKADEIWCWGSRSEIEALFADNLIEIVDHVLPTNLGAPENFHVKGFMEEALATALARDRPLLVRSWRTAAILIADAHAEDKTLLEPVFEAAGKLSGDIVGLFAPVTDQYPEPAKLSWAEAVSVSITQKQGETWAVLEPDIWVWPPRGREVATEFMDGRRRGRFNNKYNVLLDAWVRVLIGSSERRTAVSLCAFDGAAGPANPAFELGSQTAFAFRLQA
jgi:hypothetical protein